MSGQISAKKYYEPLVRLAELANLMCTEKGQERLGAFTLRDCEQYGIPGGWFFSRVNATSYAAAVDAALRLLAGIKEAPEPGTTAAISFSRQFPGAEIASSRDGASIRPVHAATNIFPSAEIVLNSDGRLSKGTDFFDDVFLPAVIGRYFDRVRLCPVCGKVFIKLRIDASACRGACTITYNKRRFDSREARRRYRANHKKNVRARRERVRMKKRRLK